MHPCLSLRTFVAPTMLGDTTVWQRDLRRQNKELFPFAVNNYYCTYTLHLLRCARATAARGYFQLITIGEVLE